MAHDHHDSGDCRALFAKLSAYLDDELDERTCAEIRRHADHCAPCSACIETLRRTVVLCQETPPKTPSPEFSSQLRLLISQMAAEASARS